MRPAPQARPVAPYLGGKRNLAQRLVERIDAIPHQLYAEPFIGMGGVFLRRGQMPRAEVINDYSRDVATLFRVLQRHYVAFLEMLRFQLTTRAEFDRLLATPADTLTDLERAARFLYLQRTGFGGRVVGRTFGVSPDRPARFDVTRLQPLLEEVHERLAGVVIECLPFQEFIPRYDRPSALFYLDPPYAGGESDYGQGVFSAADFEVLRDLLASLKGQFLLSINDTPQIRALFKGFAIEAVKVHYSAGINDGKRERAGELIISRRRRRAR